MFKTLFRIIADICLVAMVVWAPWWLILLGAIVFAWLFAPYFEAIIAGMIFDSLYGIGSFYATAVALIVFAVSIYIKKRTRI